MSALISALGYLPRFTRTPSAPQWDQEYGQGRWAYLSGLPELAHYSVLAGYALWAKQGGSLLDVGCGEGLLCRLLPGDRGLYRGLDLAAPAIEQAVRAHGSPTTHFTCADFTQYETSERYDTIVFNESLYYAPLPGTVLRRYARFLKDDGVFIVSMYLPRRAAVWKEVDRACRTLDEVEIRHASGRSWLCLLASPKR